MVHPLARLSVVLVLASSGSALAQQTSPDTQSRQAAAAEPPSPWLVAPLSSSRPTLGTARGVYELGYGW